MGESFEQRTFRQSADNCRWCRIYCEEKNNYDDNVYSRQAMISLGYIKNPLEEVAENLLDKGDFDSKMKNFLIAKSAKEFCKSCDYKSERIISVLESNGIKLY